jgi:hypothetical protein
MVPAQPREDLPRRLDLHAAVLFADDYAGN